ncbi:hypothetical protein Emag_002594 [Eimeria magna]
MTVGGSSRTGGAQPFIKPATWGFQAPLTTTFSQYQETAGSGLYTRGGNRIGRACLSNKNSRCRLLASDSGGGVEASEPLLTPQGAASPTQGNSLQSAHSAALLPPRGFRDFPPSAFAVHKHIFSLWREVAEEFGFQEYKAPSVESGSLYPHFERQATMPASEPHATCLPPHVYRLHGSKGLCLRPELTPSLVRMLQREELHRPSSFARRWFSIERVWRHERPGLGRRREHFQLNMDIAFPSHVQHTPQVAPPASSFQVKGRKSEEGQRLNKNDIINNQEGPRNLCGLKDLRVLAVAELIAAAVRIFQELGLKPADVRVRVGSRALLCGLLSLWRLDASSDNRENAPVHACHQASPTTPLPERATAGFVASTDSFAERMDRALRVLDRAGKRSRAQTEAALGEALKISRGASGRLFERVGSFDISDDAVVHEVAAGLSFHSGSSSLTKDKDAKNVSSLHALSASLREMRMLLWLLQEVYVVREWVDVDLLIVRGLHYYTGIVFEAFDAEGTFRAILGGGCYGERVNSLTCANVTRTFEGVGLGMGDCVLLELLQRKRLLPASKANLDVAVVLKQSKRARWLCNDVEARAVEEEETHDNQQTRDADRSPSHAFLPLPQLAKAQALCKKLRADGLKVELLLPPQHSTRASMKHAQSLGAKVVVFVAALSGTECKRDIGSGAEGDFVEEGEAFFLPEEESLAGECERQTRVQFEVVLRQSVPKKPLQGTEVVREDQGCLKSANANSTEGLDCGDPPNEASPRFLKAFGSVSRVATFLRSHFNQL